jgi:hypothetical protein
MPGVQFPLVTVLLHLEFNLLGYYFVARLIRLEFNSIDCQYYTELDAVALVGKEPGSGESIR